jgi:hypothetical protein
MQLTQSLMAISSKHLWGGGLWGKGLGVGMGVNLKLKVKTRNKMIWSVAVCLDRLYDQLDLHGGRSESSNS